MPKKNDLEHKALMSIANTGNEGVLQSDLWRKLGASSREGSRIALKLENRGLINRQKELCEGRWTYRLYPKRKPASINSIADCPCLTCSENLRCGSWGASSPNDCDKLTEWILKQTSEEMLDPQGDS
jgi:predicted transcriptional regulator